MITSTDRISIIWCQMKVIEVFRVVLYNIDFLNFTFLNVYRCNFSKMFNLKREFVKSSKIFYSTYSYSTMSCIYAYSTKCLIHFYICVAKMDFQILFFPYLWHWASTIASYRVRATPRKSPLRRTPYAHISRAIWHFRSWSSGKGSQSGAFTIYMHYQISSPYKDSRLVAGSQLRDYPK